MKVVVGLGNPGEEYFYTRHNIGFQITAELARRNGVKKSSYKFDGLYGDFRLGSEKVIVFQPMKYMNRSGQPIMKLIKYFDIESEDLLVVHDDLDLDFGKIRFKKNGGAGGHNGIKSIIQRLGTDEFCRLKVGIGRPPEKISVPDYVLSKFSSEEKEFLDEIIARSVLAVECMIKENIDTAMNKYNN